MKIFRTPALRPSFRSLTALGLSLALVSGCVLADHPENREDTAKRTAAPVFMLPRDIAASPFMLQSYDRVYEKDAPATLYIEGDGVPYVTADQESTNPTPVDPVALRLAARDGGKNVIWLGRPCQYNEGWQNGKDCPSIFWTNKRFSPEVIAAYMSALDQIKQNTKVTGFNLVGYDGGAAIAAILAGKRDDILSLRTVAGNLDHRVTSQVNGTKFLDGSLNPVDFSAQIAQIPQRHFIGKLDRVTPPAVYNSYAQTAGNGSCLSVTLVDNADHQLGWVEQWTVLKDMPLDCANPAEPAPVPFDPTPLDGDKGKMAK
jgi:hypothetical protein